MKFCSITSYQLVTLFEIKAEPSRNDSTWADSCNFDNYNLVSIRCWFAQFGNLADIATYNGVRAD